jgi:hypothetical protein
VVELSLGGGGGGGAHHEQDVKSGEQVGRDPTQDRAQSAALTIADNGSPQASTGRYAKTRLFKSVPAIAQQQ